MYLREKHLQTLYLRKRQVLYLHYRPYITKKETPMVKERPLKRDIILHLPQCFFLTCLLQGDDHGSWSKGVPCRAVVSRLEIWLHDIIDSERGQNGAPLWCRSALLNCVPLQQRPSLFFPHILLPGPNLQKNIHAFIHTHIYTLVNSNMGMSYIFENT